MFLMWHNFIRLDVQQWPWKCLSYENLEMFYLNWHALVIFLLYLLHHVFYMINNAYPALFGTAFCQHMSLKLFLLCFAFVSLAALCVWLLYHSWSKETELCVARPGFSTVYVTLCLRYSMYWFPRYNVSFRQNFTVRNSHSQLQDQDRAMDQDQDQDQGQGHLSNSDEEGGIARRRVPRRTSSEIASAKIAGRPVPAKVRE